MVVVDCLVQHSGMHGWACADSVALRSGVPNSFCKPMGNRAKSIVAEHVLSRDDTICHVGGSCAALPGDLLLQR
jgi:hypothetical protein